MTNDDWNPGPKYTLYLQKIEEILTEEQRTVRDIYYALEARGFPAELERHGHDFEYRYVKRAVKKGRRHGYIDPGLIVDTSRRAVTEQDPSFPEPEQWVKNVESHLKNGYYQNFWDDQPKYVEVWLEKASLASVFQPICDDHNVRLEATRGDWSDSKVYEATQRLLERLRDDKDVRVLYFGDFNPSGLHAPVAVQKTMSYYGLTVPRNWDVDAQYFDIWPFSEPLTGIGDGSLSFERVALNLEHIERFDLPENPTPSSTDKDATLKERFMAHASDGRDVNIELNALKEYHRDYLEERLGEAIDVHIDEEAKARTDERVDQTQDTIADAVEIDYSVLS